MVRPLLTIAIPTYNRANLLDICLSKIYEQVGANNDLIEVIVSNNASTDHTKQIVDKFQYNFSRLRYSENKVNGGPDVNIAKCFELAEAKYVWIFSDDDLLLPGAINNIIKLLENYDLGVVFLKPSFYHDFIEEYTPDRKPFEYELYDDAIALVSKMHYWTTYITGTITNKDIVLKCDTLYRYQNSFLIQLGWVLPAMFIAKQNANITSELILGRALAVLDFKLFHVFGTSYPRVVNNLASTGAIPILAKDLLLDLILQLYFPFYIKPSVRYTHGEKPLLILSKAYWNRKKFWTIIVPLIVRRDKILIFDTIIKPLRSFIKKIITKTHEKGNYLVKLSKIGSAKKKLKSFGQNSILPELHILLNPEFVEIGSRFEARSTFVIEAYTEYAGERYLPSVVIGNGVKIGNDCQINCCDSVQIGNLVMIGNRVLITDNEIDSSPEAIANYAPTQRKRKVKGPVIIADRVLIEDGVRVLSGVTIGANAIIRANSTIYQDVLPNTIVTSDDT